MTKNSSITDILPEVVLPTLPDDLYWHVEIHKVEIHTHLWSAWSNWKQVRTSHKKFSNSYIEEYAERFHNAERYTDEDTVEKSKFEIKATKGYTYNIWDKIFLNRKLKENYFLMERESVSEILVTVRPIATDANPRAIVNKQNIEVLAQNAYNEWSENKDNEKLYGDYPK